MKRSLTSITWFHPCPGISYRSFIDLSLNEVLYVCSTNGIGWTSWISSSYSFICWSTSITSVTFVIYTSYWITGHGHSCWCPVCSLAACGAGLSMTMTWSSSVDLYSLYCTFCYSTSALFWLYFSRSFLYLSYWSYHWPNYSRYSPIFSWYCLYLIWRNNLNCSFWASGKFGGHWGTEN